MKNVPDIVNELGVLSPVVAGIPRVEAPFTVPAGYFENFADSLVAHLRAGRDKGVREELKGISPYFSQFPRTFFFDIPSRYFEDFPAQMMMRIRAMEAGSATEELQALSPLLGGIGKKTPFSLPAGYFNELSGNLVAGMQAVDFVRDELEDGSALLTDLKEKNPYTVPAGYFEQLPGQILQRVQPDQQPAKVVTMKPRRMWLRYAAAAMLAGLVVAGSLLYVNRAKPGVEDPAAGLVKVSDQEILNYMETDANPFTGSAAVNSGTTVASIDDLSDNDIRDMMSDVSDKELEQYASDQLSPKDLQTN
ncbi:MAG TPA: hypothetical protein VMI35_14105 [Puia sp.]|nr:hypothetical protein [Puia sp.]